MKKVESITSFDRIKLLADSRRLDILRFLMASPATLTHLARTMKQSPAWIRHHILSRSRWHGQAVSESLDRNQRPCGLNDGAAVLTFPACLPFFLAGEITILGMPRLW